MRRTASRPKPGTAAGRLPATVLRLGPPPKPCADVRQLRGDLSVVLGKRGFLRFGPIVGWVFSRRRFPWAAPACPDWAGLIWLPLPMFFGRLAARESSGELPLDRDDLGVQPSEFRRLLGASQHHAVLAAAQDRLLDVGEEGPHRVEVPHRRSGRTCGHGTGSTQTSAPATRCPRPGRDQPTCVLRSPWAGRRLPRS